MSQKSGILPAHSIHKLVDDGQIITEKPLDDDQIQPASLDLRLGKIAYRVQASFLPGAHKTVGQRLNELSLHEIMLTDGAVLETNCVYIVPLLESVKLGDNISAMANPKSSTGRIDVFTRLITDYGQAFDTIPAGYQGQLYAEISPRTFPILVRTGSRLSQMRFRIGSADHSDAELRQLHETHGLVQLPDDGDFDINIDNGIAFRVDLKGIAVDGQTGPNLVGYRAKRHSGLIDVDKKAALKISDYWEAIYANEGKSLVLDPDQFYILASKEAVHVPPHYAAEMVPYNTLVGEFRVHYAGFFDPGFGHDAAGGHGSRGVLEMRSHDVPFILEDGQIIGRLVYEKLTDAPRELYGQLSTSNYQAQGLKLSKHFRNG
ncbi:MAG: 2'-deoxycytidine 5'-triphosphate deaminase [Hyphomicrobiales bacterium]|nr:MAG: 2'-deoxycytidine 5'-triphosphate deaminase [Hyphomicrobiales bacterium]